MRKSATTEVAARNCCSKCIRERVGKLFWMESWPLAVYLTDFFSRRDDEGFSQLEWQN